MENSSCKVFILNRGIVTDTMSNHTPRARMVWSAFHSTKAVVSLGEWGLSNGLQRFWLYHCDHCRALTQVYLKLPLVLKLWVLWIDLRRFWVHCHGYHHALTLACWNSPRWRSCEHLKISCIPSGCHCLPDSSVKVATWRVLIGMSRKPAAYNYKGSLWMRLEYEWVEPNRICPSIHKVRIRHDTMSVVATWTNTSLKKVKCSEM